MFLHLENVSSAFVRRAIRGTHGIHYGYLEPERCACVFGVTEELAKVKAHCEERGVEVTEVAELRV